MDDGIPPGNYGFKALGNGADTFLRPSIDHARDCNGERAVLAKRKIEALASESQSAKNKMGWKMTLVHKGHSLPDNGGRYIDVDDDFNPMRKAETPVIDSQSAKTKMGQEMVLLHQQSSSRHVDVDGDYNPRDEQLANVAGKQFAALDDCDNPYGDVGYGPIRKIMRSECVQNGQGKFLGSLIKPGTKKTSTKKDISGLTKTYKRKTRRPPGSKSAKSKIEQKPVLFGSSFGSSNYSNADRDDYFDPLTRMRKRGRPARSKSARRKTEQEPLLVDSSSSSSEGMEDKDDDFQPEVSGDGNGRKKYARINSAALKRAVEVEKKLPAEGLIFVKCMVHSQVVQGFSLGIPAIFCRDHLPNHDDTIVLEDEAGKTYETKYIAYNMRLSGGWKGFVKQQQLKVDDAVVFQLVRPTTFKVYILRENEFTATDGALGLLNLARSSAEHSEAHA